MDNSKSSMDAAVSDAEHRQRDRELVAVQLGVTRYWNAQEGRPLGHTAAGADILDTIGCAVAAAIAERQTLCSLEEPLRWDAWLLALQPGVLAALVLHSVMSQPDLYTGTGCTPLAFDVALAVRDQIARTLWLSTPQGRAMRELLKRTQAASRVSISRREMAAVKRAEKVSLGSYRTRLLLGSELVELFFTSSGGWFEKAMAPTGSRSGWMLKLTPEGAQRIRQVHDSCALFRPVMQPMVAPPRPWRLGEEE